MTTTTRRLTFCIFLGAAIGLTLGLIAFTAPIIAFALIAFIGAGTIGLTLAIAFPPRAGSFWSNEPSAMEAKRSMDRAAFVARAGYTTTGTGGTSWPGRTRAGRSLGTLTDHYRHVPVHGGTR